MVDAAVTTFDFERVYQRAADPWEFEHSPYEQARYRTMLAALGGLRYRSAFEPGCSIGVFTRMLARRCDAIFATDISPSAIKFARRRCKQFSGVRFSSESLANITTKGPFDLIVLSEVGYYFSRVLLQDILTSVLRRASKRCELLLVHWRGKSADHLLSGDEVHRAVGMRLATPPRLSLRTTNFRLDSWVITR